MLKCQKCGAEFVKNQFVVLFKRYDGKLVSPDNLKKICCANVESGCLLKTGLHSSETDI